MNSKLSNLPIPSNDIEEAWASFRDTVHYCPQSPHSDHQEPPGLVRRKWPCNPCTTEGRAPHTLSPPERPLLPSKKKAAFINLHNQIQTKLRSLQDTWLNAEADKIQGFADWHDTKRCYDALKSVYRPQSSGSFPVIGATLLFQSFWDQEQLPQEFRDATMVHIYKCKGNQDSGDNHRGISFLSTAG